MISFYSRKHSNSLFLRGEKQHHKEIKDQVYAEWYDLTNVPMPCVHTKKEPCYCGLLKD